VVAQYRDDRLKLVQPGTVRRELAIIQHCFEIAKKEWGLPILTNPVQQVTVPEAQRSRERRLEDGESDLLASAAATSAWYLRPHITAPVIRILKTKNGHPRTIPLTPKAVEILASLDRKDERVFPVTPNAVRLAWERLRKRAGLEDLRLHDLRHEAVSRFFEYGLTVPEVALISGHRDPRMLSRYTHLRPEKVAEKLARATT
jgi:integrase